MGVRRAGDMGGPRGRKRREGRRAAEARSERVAQADQMRRRMRRQGLIQKERADRTEESEGEARLPKTRREGAL